MRDRASANNVAMRTMKVVKCSRCWLFFSYSRFGSELLQAAKSYRVSQQLAFVILAVLNVNFYGKSKLGKQWLHTAIRGGKVNWKL